jgi:thioesterase domain-containing protein
MTKQALLEKIESLSPEKRAEVEELVERLAQSRPATAQAPTTDARQALIARIRARREQIFQERGLLDLQPVIREFRETGGR